MKIVNLKWDKYDSEWTLDVSSAAVMVTVAAVVFCGGIAAHLGWMLGGLVRP